MDADTACQRALRQLDTYGAAVRSVAARVAWLHQCAEAAGLDMDAWRELPFEQREAIVRRGSRVLGSRDGLPPVSDS
jgi:hypothetical protein